MQLIEEIGVGEFLIKKKEKQCMGLYIFFEQSIKRIH